MVSSVSTHVAPLGTQAARPPPASHLHLHGPLSNLWISGRHLRVSAVAARQSPNSRVTLLRVAVEARETTPGIQPPSRPYEPTMCRTVGGAAGRLWTCSGLDRIAPRPPDPARLPFPSDPSHHLKAPYLGPRHTFPPCTATHRSGLKCTRPPLSSARSCRSHPALQTTAVGLRPPARFDSRRRVATRDTTAAYRPPERRGRYHCCQCRRHSWPLGLFVRPLQPPMPLPPRPSFSIRDEGEDMV